jgi:hypothetical protein
VEYTPAIDVYLFTSNLTLRTSLVGLLPVSTDAIVKKNPKLAEEETYKLHVSISPVHEAWGIKASIKCLQESSVDTVLADIGAMLVVEAGKVLPGSWIGKHMCAHDDSGDASTECIIEKLWSK